MLKDLWRRLRADFAILAAFAGIALLSFLFLKLGSEVLDGETMAIDRWVLLALRDPSDLSVTVGPAWFRSLMLDITAVGGVWGLTLTTVVVTGFLIASRKYATALFVALSVTGGAVLGSLLKMLFDRPRPDVVPHLVEVTNASFPSGHAMNSAVVFLTLGVLLASTQESRRVRVYLITVAVSLTLAIGFSRLYLGVHWPSDVAAGWCVGAAWATTCWIAARLLQRTHQIEQPDGVRPPEAPAPEEP